MAERTRRQVRRGVIVLAYGLTTGLLLHLVGEDLPRVGQALAEIALVVPEPLRPVEASVGFAVVAGSLFATVAGLGAFFLSRRTGTGFGLLTVATVAWVAFPYARLPWARLLEATPTEIYAAPASVWILSAGLLAMATVEIGVCARENVLRELARRGLPAQRGSTAEVATRNATRRWLASSVLVGSLIVLLFALLHPLSEPLAGSLDLLWAPALAGLVAGAALWLWARR